MPPLTPAHYVKSYEGLFRKMKFLIFHMKAAHTQMAAAAPMNPFLMIFFPKK